MSYRAVVVGALIVAILVPLALHLSSSEPPPAPSSHDAAASEMWSAHAERKVHGDAVNIDAWARRSEASVSSNSNATRLELSAFVAELLQFHSGKWCNIFDAYALLRPKLEVPCADEITQEWSINKAESTPKQPPSCMSDLMRFLRTLHFHISVGLSRLALDKTLAAMLRQQPDARSRALLELDIAAVVAAYLQAGSLALQTFADGFSVDPGDLLRELGTVAAQQRFDGASSSGGRKETAAAVLSADQNAAARWLRLKCRQITLFPHAGAWAHQRPIVARFWNNHRPLLSCRSVTRSCELPEGCRLMCNPEYAFSGRDGSEFEVVGFGSNNEFDWESSVIRALQRAGQHQDGGGAARLGSVSTFDCTLLTRKNPGVRPSPLVKSIGDKFRFLPFCLGGVATPAADFATDGTSSSSADKPLPYLQRLTSASSGDKMTPATITMAELRRVLDWQDQATGRKRPSDMKLGAARRIHLLKLDIESFEFVALPRWLQLDLSHVREQLDATSASSVDFTTAPFLDVRQVQVELHRRGFSKDGGSGAVSSLWMLWHQLTYMSLGFVPVAAEKNYFSSCCFEHVFVHQRFWLESEASFRE